MTIDLESLPKDDREFIRDISPRVTTRRDGSPDLAELSIPELRRLHDIIGENVVEIPSP